MQYSFDFTEKAETPDLDLSHLDYQQLSGFAEFSEKLANFNEQYEMDLVATKSARWQPGTYNKLKASVSNVLYPHWKKRRGANSINKLLETNNWRYQNFKDSLDKLDNMLYHYRKDGTELYTDEDLDEAKGLLYELLNSFTTEYDNVKVEISPIPHYGRTLRGYRGDYDDASSDRIGRLYPEINENNEIVGVWNTVMYEGLDHANDIKYDHFGENNPGKWFINIRVLLDDVKINVTNSDMSKQYAEIPYGKLVVCFTVDLITLVTNHRRMARGQHLVKTENVGTVAHKFPHLYGIEHPFVYTSDRYAGTNMMSHFNTYGNGNVCFGELAMDIYGAIFQGNITLLKMYLNIWANSFSVGVTSPLNTLAKVTFGVREEWDENTRAHISGSSGACYKYIQNANADEKSTFVDKYCTGCAITETCRTYAKLNMDKVSWADVADSNWVQAYNKLCIHLSDEIDASKIYEMFADMYYYKTIDRFNRRTVERVFGENMTVRDFYDYRAIMDNFTLTEPNEHNIILMYEMFSRGFVLNKVYSDNRQMYEELALQTEGMCFEEATSKLTNNDIENNHYSWLYAQRYVSSRDEYWTYNKFLNGREEGVRYGN
jgi:hypothetical protein